MLQPLNIVLAENDTFFRAGIAQIAKQHMSIMEIHEVENFQNLWDCVSIAGIRLDLIIVNLNLFIKTAPLKKLAGIRQQSQCPIIVISDYHLQFLEPYLFSCGVDAYVPKSISVPQFIDTMTSMLHRPLMADKENVSSIVQGWKMVPKGDPFNILNPEERIVLRHLLNDVDHRVIRERMGLTIRRFSDVKLRILSKTKCDSLTELLVAATIFF